MDLADPTIRERAAEELFVARGYRREFWREGGNPHTDGLRKDCRYLIDRVFDAIQAVEAI